MLPALRERSRLAAYAVVAKKTAEVNARQDIAERLHCHSCVQIQAGSHPDVVLLTNERVGAATKTGTLGVALARFVQADVSVKPYYGPYKIYIIPNAENLNQQAQNALLKTLEEPPAYAVFLLLAQNTSVFLPTVLSRCVSIALHDA